MPKDFIKKVSIKEDFVYIADNYIDLGKVIHVWKLPEFQAIQFHFMGGEKIVFENPHYETEKGWETKWAYPFLQSGDSIELKREEFDALLDFVKQRFGGKEIKKE